jgi:hypothetical protein
MKFKVALLLLGASACAAGAEELVPLADLIEQGAEDTYPLIRCAAFHLATTEWIGSEAMGSEQFETLIGHASMLTVMAAAARAEKAKTNISDEADTAYGQARALADLYRARFDVNYIRTGHAFGRDPVWTSDLQK